jgi:hypothetical protein
MSEVGATRPRWRDVLVLAVLAAVIVGGLVHYGRGLGDDPRGGTSASGDPASEASPSADATAELEGAPTTDPGEPATPIGPRGGTCWDGRPTTSLKLCGLPDGARGLAWVFPSFADHRAECHRAQPNDDSYPAVESYECFQRALGQAVTVTYDQVDDPARVERWLLSRLGSDSMREIPGPNGGRYIFKDGHSRPARITGMYQRFPYVVSVYAASPQAASRAWQTLVSQRAEDQIRGVPAG